MLLLLKFYMSRAQHRMKQHADKNRSDREFSINDLVYVKLQPYRQHSLVYRLNQKLSPRYYGPYKIIDRCGKVAYKLDLPSESRVHNVFHVSQLKKSVGSQRVASSFPTSLADVFDKFPEKIMFPQVMSRHSWKETASQPKIKFFTQVKARPPTFVAFVSGKTQLLESDIRFLTKSLKEDFDLGGTLIRIIQRVVPRTPSATGSGGNRSGGRVVQRTTSDKRSVSA